MDSLTEKGERIKENLKTMDLQCGLFTKSESNAMRDICVSHSLAVITQANAAECRPAPAAKAPRYL